MTAKPIAKLRSLAVAVCCAALTLFNGGAAAEENEGEHVHTSAKAAALIEMDTGMVLLSNNMHAPLPMASTTKVMTALLALEYGKLDEVVTVSRNAYGVPGTSIYLSLGEKITLRDLLYGLMLASGNDAAVAIAEHVSGDVATFCRRMTERAAELGCKNTVFLSPNGLPTDGHFTTAYDLALIAREAMSHPLFREIVSTKRASIPWEGRSYDRVLNNKNRLLSDYPGATGIKTGYTRAAGRCLVFGAERDGLEVIGVVLGCGDWFDEAARLMDMGFERYESFTALYASETVRVLPVENGTQETVAICADGTLSAPVRKGRIPALELDLPKTVAAGTEVGTRVGEARLVLDGKTLASVGLAVSETLGVRDYRFALGRVLRSWPLEGESMAQ